MSIGLKKPDGYNWTLRNYPNNNQTLNSIVITESSQAVAVGSNGTILISQDGGINWDSRYLDIPVYLWGVAYSKRHNAFIAVGDDAKIFVSNDAYHWSTTSSIKKISQFSINGQTANIDENNHTISVPIPFNTKVDNLIANFTINGDYVTVGNVRQISGQSANNFSNSVMYTVHAADGSTQNYSIKLIPQLWEAVGKAGFSDGAVNYTSIAFNPDNNQPYIVYSDGAYSGKATVMTFDGNIWVPVGNKGFSNNPVKMTKIVFANKQLYVVYLEYEEGTNAPKVITVMTFNGKAWVSLGSKGFASKLSINGLDMALNPINNHPYVGYTEFYETYTYGYETKLSVLDFGSKNLPHVGKQINNIYTFSNIGIAFNPVNKQLYIAYIDNAIVVMSLKDNHWTAVGNSDAFNAHSGSGLKLAFGPRNGQPYLVYRDFNSNRAAGITFSESNWVPIGGSLFLSPEKAYDFDIGFINNQLYTVYQDIINSNKTTTIKFNGESWVLAGDPGFSSGSASYPSITFNPANNQPYVGYVDEQNSNKATVMMLKDLKN